MKFVIIAFVPQRGHTLTHGSCMRRLAISLLLLLPSVGIATSIDAQAWDAAPFRSATPIPRDGLPPGRSQFLAWLERQGTGLAPQQRQPALERLYVYISELAKTNAGRFPTSVDSTAPALFWLAARLGDAGASQVVRRLSTDSTLMPPPHPVPGATLTLTPPSFALASADSSWRVCFPYYFMAAPRGRQLLGNAVLTDIVVLSTLFAPDQGPAGSSQATIMLVAAAPSDSARHLRHWREQLHVSAARAPREDSTGVWFASAPGEQMSRLAVVRRLPKAVVLVAYIGVAGTFEANRPHFFNFLSTLGSSRCAT